VVAVHGQFQFADDPANHSASDRPIGRYRRRSSLSAQAHQTKNRCRVQTDVLDPEFLCPVHIAATKSLLSRRQVVGQCEFAIKRESSIDDDQNQNKLQPVINVLLLCGLEVEDKMAPSHARTLVRECYKGDDESQWERGKFDPPPPKKTLNGWSPKFV